MDSIDKLSAECLVACDQSYQAGIARGTHLDQYLDGGDVPLVTTMPSAFYDMGVTDWVVDFRRDDLQTGFGATVYKRISGAKTDYMVAMQGTRGPSAQDWNANLNFGIDKLNSAGYRDLKAYLDTVADNTTTGDVLFTGQSLGGALAEYAAYDFAAENADFDKSHLALVTYNGLGGIAGLQSERPGFNPNILAGGTTRHYWIQGDLVNRLGAGTGNYANLVHLNGAGNEYRLDYFDGTLPDGSPKWLSAVDAHRIESGFYAGITKNGTQWSAHPAAITPLAVTELARFATGFGNLYNSVDSAQDGEATARLFATLVYSTAYGEEKELGELINAVADGLYHSGQIDKKQYDFAKSSLPKMLAELAQSPGGVKLQMRSLVLATLMDTFENDPSGTVTQAKIDEILRGNALYQNTNRFYDNATLQAVRSLTVSALDNWVGQPDDKLRATLAVARQVVSDTLADGDTYASVRQILQGHMNEVIDVLMDPSDHPIKNLLYKVVGWSGVGLANQAVALGEAVGFVKALLQGIHNVPGILASTYLAFVNEAADAVASVGKSIANSIPDFNADYSGAPIIFPEIAAFSDQSAVIDQFTSRLTGLVESAIGSLAGIADQPTTENLLQSFNQTEQIVVDAGQTIILRPGSGPNPFDATGGPGDVNASAPASINEKGTATFTVYLPYAAGEGGQRIRLQLTGSAAGAFDVVATSGAYPVGPDGTFDLLIHEGQKQITFALAELRDIDVSETLGLNATLIGANDTPTHASHLEVNLSLAAVNESTVVPPSGTISGTAAADFMSTAGINGSEVVTPALAPLSVVEGGEGNDFIERLHSGDETFGGAGNDWITGNDDGRFPGREQRVDGGEGNDLIASVGGGGTLKGGEGNDLIDGSSRWTYEIDGHTQVSDWAILSAIFSPAFKPATYQTHVSDGNGGTTYFQTSDLGNWRARQDGTLTLEMRAGYANATGVTSGGWRWTTTTTNDVTTIEFVQLSTGNTARWTVESALTPILDVDQKSLTLDGGDDNDALVGTSKEDMIAGGAGSDLIEAGTDNDTVFGDIALDPSPTGQADGDDQIALGAGDDYALAGGGNDLVWAETGSDTVFGGAGNDVLFGDNSMGGADSADFLDGGADDDILYGAAGADTLTGGSGNDVLLGDHAFNTAAEMAGDILDGGVGDDELWGYGGNDQLSGGSGVDVLVGGTGTDTLDGGGDADELWGQEENDTLTGGTGDDFLDGGAGSDVMYGGDGADELWGEQVDVSSSASGNDNIRGESGNDSIVGGAGNDTLDGGVDNDGVWGGVGNDTLLGGAGDDGLYGEGDDDTLAGGAGSDVLNGGAGIDQLYGGAGPDTLKGGSDADTLRGSEGTDYLEGGSGADTYVFIPGDGARNAQGQVDAVVDTDSNSTFQFGGGVTRQAVTVRRNGTTYDLLVQYGDTDAFIVSDGMNRSGASFRFSDGTTATLASMLSAGLTGGTGNDVLQGFSNSNDLLDGGAGNDTISAASGNDILIGGAGDDTLLGEYGDDSLDGGSGNDTLMGGNGNDRLRGGIGVDSLAGGPGNDTYLFDLGEGSADSSGSVDRLADLEGLSTFQFGEGISRQNVIVRREGLTNDVSVTYGQGDKVVVADGATSASAEFRFSDGSSASLTSLLADGLLGGPGDDRINGFDDSGDLIDGGSGSDTMTGGAGDDIYVVDSVGDSVLEFRTGFTPGWSSVGPTSIAMESTSAPNAQGNVTQGSSGSVEQQLTGQGRFIVFSSGSPNLVPDDTNGGPDVFVKNLNTGDIVRVSTDSGSPETTIGSNPEISANGRYLFLVSRRSDLVANDINGTNDDIFLKDLQTGEIRLVSTGSNGQQSSSGWCMYPSISSDGRMLVFVGDRTNLAPGASHWSDIYAKDVSVGTITHVSASYDGTQTNGASDRASISRDGRYVAFYSEASNLTPGDINNRFDLFIKDLSNGSLRRIDSDYFYYYGRPKVFADGRYVLFNYAQTQIAVKDLRSGDVTVVSSASDGAAGNGLTAANEANVSADGRFIVFASSSSNLVSGDTNGMRDVFVKDRLTGNIVRVSTSASGEPANGESYGWVSISEDGRFISFTSLASNLVPDDTNGQMDVFAVPNPLYEGGNDTVRSSVSYSLPTNVENLVLTGTGALSGTGNELNNSISGNSGDDVLTGAAGDDLLSGLSGNDVLDGGSGNDVLDGGAGNDIMAGGFGNDAYVVDASGDTITEDSNGGLDIVTSSVSFDLPDHTESLELLGSEPINGTGNEESNVISGNGVANFLRGDAGDDRLLGLGGDDRLAGDLGADTMIGGLGDDTYVVESTVDVVLESASEGTDTIESPISWTLNENVENLTLTGTSAINGTGNALSNVLLGNGAANILEGGAGADQMLGGGGNDIYVVDSAPRIYLEWDDAGLVLAPRVDSVQTGPWDSVVENPGGGTDTVRSSITYMLPANVENLTLTGANSADAIGNESDNVLTGNAESNELYGGAGADTMQGGAGDDLYVVQDLGDQVIEGANAGEDSVLSYVSYSLNANVEDLELGGTANINATGNDLDNWMCGNAGDNVLVGGGGSDILVNYSSGVDILDGGLGNDLYSVWAQSAGTTVISSSDATTGKTDTLYLEFDPQATTVERAGQDLKFSFAGSSAIVFVKNYFASAGATLIERFEFSDGTVWTNSEIAAQFSAASEGDDHIVGTAGNDTISALGGSDVVDAGDGNDIVDGGSGDDVLNGQNGQDSLSGNGGNDILDGGASADTLVGGPGNDSYIVDATTDVVTELANEGTDLVQSTATFTLANNIENLTLAGTSAINGTGNALDNVLVGNSATNTLTGGDGNDTLEGGAGTDTLAGGLGNDTYVVDSTTDTITEAASAGTDTVRSSVTITLASNVENLVLTGTAAINGNGNSLNNVLTGNAVNNLLNGGAGSDTMAGGTGDDTYVVDATGDAVTEVVGEGNDLVQAGVTYTLSANVENLTLTGATAINGTGNALANVLVGNSANNTLTGGDGNDSIDGGTGNDTMVGGLGDDTYTVNISTDVVTEAAGAGTDRVLSSVTLTLAANVETLTLTGTGAINGTGNSAANLLQGNAAINTLNGGTGNDLMQGGDGNDILTDSSGTAWFDGGSGTDTITGGSSAEIFVGGLGNDTINTGNGADILVYNKGDGSDTITGGTGTDNVVSLGRGIRYADLKFRKVSNDLVMDVSATESLTFKNWYVTTANNKTVSKLQVILEANMDYNPASSDPTLNKKVEQFDFAGLATQFDQARAANPSLTDWALTNALSTYYLASSSDTAALGGDLAYYYGLNGNVTGMTSTAAQEVIANASLGTANQTLRPFAGISGGGSALQ